MKLSSNTTSVLKNFSTINQNLVIKEGNTITTMSAMKNIVAKIWFKFNIYHNFNNQFLNNSG